METRLTDPARQETGDRPATMGATERSRDEPLYLEDLHLGLRFSTESHPLDAQQIKAFARQFDAQPFHLDEEAASRTLFGGLVASGWHTAAITMRLLVGMKPQLAGGLLGAGGEISWPTAARPGDVLHVEGELTEIKPSRSRPDRGIVTMRAETRTQRGSVVQVLEAKLVVFRRDAAEPPQAR
jgi:acyl dehydratase